MTGPERWKSPPGPNWEPKELKQLVWQFSNCGPGLAVYFRSRISKVQWATPSKSSKALHDPPPKLCLVKGISLSHDTPQPQLLPLHNCTGTVRAGSSPGGLVAEHQLLNWYPWVRSLGNVCLRSFFHLRFLTLVTFSSIEKLIKHTYSYADQKNMMSLLRKKIMRLMK